MLALTSRERAAREALLLNWEVFVSESMDWPSDLEMVEDSLSD